MQNDRKLSVFDPNNRVQMEGFPRLRRGCFARNLAFIFRAFGLEDVGVHPSVQSVYFHGSRRPSMKLASGKTPPAPKTAVPAQTGFRGALSCKVHIYIFGFLARILDLRLDSIQG